MIFVLIYPIPFDKSQDSLGACYHFMNKLPTFDNIFEFKSYFLLVTKITTERGASCNSLK